MGFVITLQVQFFFFSSLIFFLRFRGGAERPG